MTETQAKSGAAGASTEADDSPVETPTNTDGGVTDSADRSVRLAESRLKTAGAGDAPSDSDSTPTRAESTGMPDADAAPKAALPSEDDIYPGGADGDGPASPAPAGTAPSPEPVISPVLAAPTLSPAPTSPTPVVKEEPKSPEPVPTSGPSVPVVAVAPSGGTARREPAASTLASTSLAGASVGSSSASPGGAAVPTAKATAPARPATGSAPVGTTGAKAPPMGSVIARATVAPPASPAKSTVSGTGLRQTTGATSVITPGRTGAVGAARVSDAVRSARATVAGAATRGPRRARLHLKRIDPWSVMKFAFAVSLVLFVVAIVATSVLYLALDAMGVFDSLNQAMADITGEGGGSTIAFRITAKGVIGTAILLGAVNMVLFTALMTLGAFVYNVCADLVGGVELTLSEKE